MFVLIVGLEPSKVCNKSISILFQLQRYRSLHKKELTKINQKLAIPRGVARFLLMLNFDEFYNLSKI